MKTIRITAISTEKARSRTQERAFQMLEWADDGAGGSTGVWLSGIALLRHYRRFPHAFGCLRRPLLEQSSQNGERDRALLQGAVVELSEVEGGAFGLLIFVAKLDPRAPAHEVHRQLRGGKLRAPQLACGFLGRSEE